MRSFILAPLLALCLAAVAGPSSAFAQEAETKNCIRRFAELAKKTLEKIELPSSIQRPYGSERGVLYPSPRDFSRAWELATELDLRVNERYLKMLIAEKDPQISFLEQIGFKFDFEKGHTIPKMKEIAQKITAAMDDLVSQGKVLPENVLKPARIFQTGTFDNRKYIAVPLNEKPPKGAEPYVGLVDANRFLEIVASGHWPIGEIVRGESNQASVALHDLGHFGAFVRNPEHMVAISRYAKTRLAERRYSRRPNLTNHVFESLAVGSPKARPFVDQQMRSVGLDFTPGQPPMSMADGVKAVIKLPEARLNEEIAKAYAIRHELVDDLGGISNDGFSKIRAREKNDARGVLENPKSELEKAQSSSDLRKKQHHFAKYLVAMDHTTRIRPADWVTELIERDNYEPSSPIYKYVCESGVLRMGDDLFDDVCRR